MIGCVVLALNINIATGCYGPNFEISSIIEDYYYLVAICIYAILQIKIARAGSYSL